MCVGIRTVKGAKLLIVLLGVGEGGSFSCCFFLSCLVSFQKNFPTSLYYICNLKQKHESLPWFLLSPLKSVGQGPRSPATRLGRAWDSAGTMNAPAASFALTQTGAVKPRLHEEGRLWNKIELGSDAGSACRKG